MKHTQSKATCASPLFSEAGDKTLENATITSSTGSPLLKMCNAISDGRPVERPSILGVFVNDA